MKQYIKNNVLKVSSGVANAIFVTIGIGFLFGTLGDMFNLPILVTIGSFTRVLLAPALGAGIAFNMQANSLTLFSAMAASTIGGGALTATDAGFTIVGGIHRYVVQNRRDQWLEWDGLYYDVSESDSFHNLQMDHTAFCF